jgi:esterase/lipase superfamily enzyme
MNRFKISNLLILVCLGLASCRLPALKLLMSTVEPLDTTLHYDSSSAKELIGKTEPDRDSLYWNYKWRYRDSLAEPVTVVDWQEKVSSTWDVLYVTNRKISQDENDTHFGSYGNEWGITPEYGSCYVKLPHRPLGKEVRIEKPSPLKKLVPVGFRKSSETPADDNGLHVEVDRPRPQDRELFFHNLKNQIDRSRQRDVLLFVHGFNVDYQSAVTRTAQVAADLPFNGAVVSYSWPSQGGLKNYRMDGDIVDQSVPAFAEFLTEMGGRLPADV